MGLYDSQCMVTNVSLLTSDAALVLLEPTADAYRPIALAVKGCSDRAGGIDLIEQREPNASLLLKFLRAKLKSGDFKVDEHALQVTQRWPIDSLERALWNFERNMNDGQDNRLFGQRIQFSLVCLPVWDAIVKAAPQTKKSEASLFKEVFAESHIAHEIYGEKLAKFSSHLRELAAINRFLTKHAIAWKPTVADGAQHWTDEMLQFLDEARQSFKATPEVLTGLNVYEKILTECMKDWD